MRLHGRGGEKKGKRDRDIETTTTTTTITMEVRETGEIGRGGKRDSDMESWGQLQLLWMYERQVRLEEEGRGTATWSRGDNYNCFGCKRDMRDLKRRVEGQRRGDVGTTTIALDVRET